MTVDDLREKVIKALECRLNINHEKYKHCLSCQYRDDIDHLQWACMTDGILEDAISLLKAQEPQYVYDCAEMIDDIVVGKCPSCDRTIVNKINDPTRFCKYCGQAVKWE